MGARVNPIRVAYADPPYPGCAHMYARPGTPEYHPDAMRWDDPTEHVSLMARLDAEFADGWALSTHTGALRSILPGAPPRTRVAAFCRTHMQRRFMGAGALAAVGFLWEPVLFSGGLEARDGKSHPDWLATCANNLTCEAFIGAKPPAFSRWLFKLLRIGAHPDDEFVDLFPGSGAVTRAWRDYQARAVELRNGAVQASLFAPNTGCPRCGVDRMVCAFCERCPDCRGPDHRCPEGAKEKTVAKKKAKARARKLIALERGECVNAGVPPLDARVGRLRVRDRAALQGAEDNPLIDEEALADGDLLVEEEGQGDDHAGCVVVRAADRAELARILTGAQ